ncbi:MAG: FG-GAP repeat domain-containing protein [Ardenticatenaceae bacterium]
MKKTFFPVLIIRRLMSLFFSSERGRSLSPILVGSSLLLVWLWLLAPSVSGADDALFSDSGQKLGDSGSAEVALGDLDGDGDLDAFVAGANRDTEGVGEPNQVWLNDGRGTFSNSGQPLGDSKSWDVALGDLDGDGDLDALVANGDIENNQLSGEPNQVWLNDGAGHFTPGEGVGDSVSTALALGDVDGDGDLDALVGNVEACLPGICEGDRNRLWLNDGRGHFSDSGQDLGGDISLAVALGDLDGDGDLDAFVGNGQICVEALPIPPTSPISVCLGARPNKVWLNDGVGTFHDTDQELGDLSSWKVALGDLDGDGDLDAFVANGQSDDNEQIVPQPNQVWLNNGQGAFVEEQSMGNSLTRAVALADLDQDGDLDAFVSNANDSNQPDNQLWLNDGAAHFTYDDQPFGGAENTAISLGDLDGDGDLDAFVGTLGADQIWWNNSPPFGENPQLLGSLFSGDVALGDLEGDGDLDAFVANVGINAAAAANKVWLNDGRQFSDSGQNLGNSGSLAVALGDLDGDHDLDAVVGNGENEANSVLFNDGTGHFRESTPLSDTARSHAIALGDLDGDADLDLFVGNDNDQQNTVWLNDGAGHFSDSGQRLGASSSRAVAFGDVDDDGDLDAFVANEGVNHLWLNDGTGLFERAQNLGSARSHAVALGDLDGDGDLDALVANHTESSKVWLNNGRGHFTNSGQSLGNAESWAMALGDVDGDGDLDAVVANGEGQISRAWLNDGAGNFSESKQSLGDSKTAALALGDLNGDGALDLFLANQNQPSQIYWARAGGPTRFQVAVQKPGPTRDANFYATPAILSERTIPITYTLFDPHSAPIARVALFYSMDGGANWQPAAPTTDTITTNLASNPYPTTNANNTHHFIWDTFASGFFGHSDNVVLRLVAYPQSSGMTGSSRYTNSVSAPSVWAHAAATTSPIRVRGTQVQVYSDTVAAGNEVANAFVYRLPAEQSAGATPMANDANEPFVTDQNGYLRGGGKLALGDQLVARLPITWTKSYTLYHTSARPTPAGLQMFTVVTPGVQPLAVSSDQPLIIFDLDVSLEWDARSDSDYLQKVENNLKRASEVLYDLTNGQVALGKIRVYHAKENWLDSHILVFANNNYRPNADLGGIVSEPMSDTHHNGELIRDAYLPGQVRMSATWNRFGQASDEYPEDWSRTLAHELGHYLLFMPDNYLGIENGLLAQVNCRGSAMTDAYSKEYSEFLPRAEWTGECLKTLANDTTGRADWQTITAFYDMLDGSGGNTGPNRLPLQLTNVSFVDPETAPKTVSDNNFKVRDENNNPLSLPFGQAQGYLFKTQGTAELTDDTVIAVGSPNQSQNSLLARGAERNDRLCLFDYSQTPRRLGCLNALTEDKSELMLHELAGWEPEIRVDSVTSRTLAITVTQQLAPDEQLYVQIFPAAHPSSTQEAPHISPVALMNPIGADSFTQSITLDVAIANGLVRVWVADSQPVREEMTEFFISDGWGPNGQRGWGPNGQRGWGITHHRYGWGVNRDNAWHAPLISRNGEVTIFDLDNVYGSSAAYELQSLSLAPQLPSWLTQVGNAYRVSANQAVTGTPNIMFAYMQRQVPGDNDQRLRIYHSPDNGQSWQPLNTQLDIGRNLASTPIRGAGIYTLISTIQVRLSRVGWNTFTYPIAETRAITSALASIEAQYTSVYYDQPNSPEWQLYDQTVADEFSDLVNDLSHLQDGRGYSIYATEAITLYIAPGSHTRHQRTTRGSQFPPATYYGWITPNDSFQPTVGMTIKARIGDTVCGESTIQQLNGQLAYKLQVKAEDPFGQPNGCGTNQQTIVFEVGNSLIKAAPRTWNNSQAQYHPLPEGFDSPKNKLYLPLITK